MKPNRLFPHIFSLKQMDGLTEKPIPNAKEMCRRCCTFQSTRIALCRGDVGGDGDEERGRGVSGCIHNPE